MGRSDDLYEKARSSPSNLRFEEALALAEFFDLELARIKGSHYIFKRPGWRGHPMNLQKMKDGKAKKRQLEQLLKLYETGSDEEQ